MFLPMMGEVRREREMVSSFAGYNHNLSIRPNEFFDMKNMSSDELPVLSPRGRRGTVRSLTKPNGLFAHDKLCWVDGTGFYYDGVLKGSVTDGEKQFVRMGAMVLIFPDKVAYNAHEDSFFSLENEIVTTDTVTGVLCRADGEPYTYIASPDEPENPEDGDHWLDTSGEKHVLKVFSAATGLWTGIPTVYVKLSSLGIGAGFSEYDGVTISGAESGELNGDFFLVAAAQDYIIITAIIDATLTQAGAVTIKRKVPDMDYVTELNNRIWGCSSEKHEIYACKLGDPKNWNVFMGLSTDSYAVTVGSGGDFTGCASHLGYALFFKENVIHKMYGTHPGNFQLSDTNARGVAKGSAKSIVIVNEALFYRSSRDICVYNSALPSGISEALPDGCHSAVAGANGQKYYMSMQRGTGEWAMFVYDAGQGCWHKEDDTHALSFAALDGELYYIDADSNKLMSVNGNITDYADSEAALEETVDWYLETGDIGLEKPDHRYISGIQIMLLAKQGAEVSIELQYDQGADWVTAAAYCDTDEQSVNTEGRHYPVKRAFTLPLHTRRCKTLRMRISGTGDVKIYSITKTIEQGSDVNGI